MYVSCCCHFKSVVVSLSLLETMRDQLPAQHLLRSGERVLRTLLLLWHEKYVHFLWGRRGLCKKCLTLSRLE